MKKITDFIVDKRYFILGLFIIFTITCFFLSSNVKINYDIAKYLPLSSKVRIGNNIMDKEFKNVETSTLNIMFQDLKSDEKVKIKEELESIKGVKEVEHDETDDYNKDNYTLYTMTIDAKKDSKLAKDIYTEVNDKYQDYHISTSGDVTESNKDVLPFGIIVLAVFCALIILIIMCESYVEPFLFLASILMAVILNKGTNIIFPSISHITNSIAAILQMALSMDYSIMLMNRYDQEKKMEKDKVKAMKKALHKAFLAISSSSITTIVGLLALIFMSFTIGKDLGFILAKGVLFSLLCIFFVLPSLILMFDKWIIKTKKKTPHIKLKKLASLSYKTRFLAIPTFLIIFILSFILKGNLGIDYTDKESDMISKVFKEQNQMAIIYKNKDEEKIASKLETLEKDNKIKEVLGYSNTINQKLSYDKLNKKLNDLGSDTSLEEYLLKIIYYDYYTKNESKITFNDFINFIETNAYTNSSTNEKIDAETKKDITRLKNFISSNNINKKRSIGDISNILEIDNDSIKELLIYYLSKNTNQELTLEEFTRFINKDVLTNKKYANKITDKSSLNTLTKFTNKETINKKLNKDSLASLFNIDKTKVNDLIKYYILKSNLDYQMTINEFSNFTLDYILKDKNYSSLFKQDDIDNLNMLKTFSNKDYLNEKMDSNSLNKLFMIDSNLIDNLLLIKRLEEDNQSKYKIIDFLNKVSYLKTDTPYSNELDTSLFSSLDMEKLSLDTKEYDKNELSKILNIKVEDINKIFNLIEYLDNKETLVETPLGLINLILESEVKNSLDTNTLSKLELLKKIMVSSLSDTKYSYSELEFLGIKKETAKEIYTLYVFNTQDIKLTPLEFTSFILNNKNDSMLKTSISSKVNDLTLVNRVMTDTLNNKKYNSTNLANFLNLNKNDLKLLYGLYNYTYVNKNYTLSLKEFVSFLLNDIVSSEYKDKLDNNKIDKLKTVTKIMNDSLNNIKYNKEEIYDIIDKLSNKVEKNTIDILYLYYGSVNEFDSSWKITVEEFVNFLNDNILNDSKFDDYLDNDMVKNIIEAKDEINDSKELLVGKNYSRVVLNTKYDLESEETFKFIESTNNYLSDIDYYLIGDSPMAYEMSNSFDNELNLITILTMLAIFIVVLVTFKSIIIPTILVLIIQCAVFLTMGGLSLAKDNVYFIAILIVQSILMGATIDYAILYTSYYLENRKTLNIK